MQNVVQMVQSKPTAEFADFWTLYPRRVARKDADRAWAKLTPDARMDALVALVDWRRVWLARGELEFVPHPATWLNGERWTDELPMDCAPRHASHAPIKPQNDSPRGDMPESVRLALAKVRERAK